MCIRDRDTTLMLSFADLLIYEDLEVGSKILVPVGFLFKYYKYLTKYLRLFIIKKYNEGVLNKNILTSATNLWTFAWKNLKIQTDRLDETSPTNIEFKKLLNEFHQNLFINKSMVKDYPELKDAIDEYDNMVFYINSSRALFKHIDDKSGYSGTTIESLTIQMADKELSKHTHSLRSLRSSEAQSLPQPPLILPPPPQLATKTHSSNPSTSHITHSTTQSTTSAIHNGGAHLQHRLSQIPLYDKYNYEDSELDNPTQGTKISKQFILNKLDNLLRNEIYTMQTLTKSIQ